MTEVHLIPTSFTDQHCLSDSSFSLVAIAGAENRESLLAVVSLDIPGQPSLPRLHTPESASPNKATPRLSLSLFKEG